MGQCLRGVGIKPTITTDDEVIVITCIVPLHCFICLLHCYICTVYTHLAKKIQQQQRPAMQSDYFFFSNNGYPLMTSFHTYKNLVVLSTIKIFFKLLRSICRWVGSYSKKIQFRFLTHPQTPNP
jgi:hypothetical protein